LRIAIIIAAIEWWTKAV